MMMMKAVTGEVIKDKAKNKKDSADPGEFYPSGHDRRTFWIHGFVFLHGKIANTGGYGFDKTRE